MDFCTDVVMVLRTARPKATPSCKACDDRKRLVNHSNGLGVFQCIKILTALKTAPITPAISGGVFMKMAILLPEYTIVVPMVPLYGAVVRHEWE